MGNLPWVRTIVLDLLGTFVKSCQSLQGLRGYTMMGNVYVEPAWQESRAWLSSAHGQRGESLRTSVLAPPVKAAEVHS